MTDIDMLVKKIGDIYSQFGEPAVELPLALQARQLMFRAEDYVRAAEILERENMVHWLPMLQLTGQAVELALKACLASANTSPPAGHDLVELCRLVQRHDFVLESAMCAAVIHLHHFYYRDLATGTKYKTRYPTKKTERLGGSVPSIATFAGFVSSLRDQAMQKLNG